jgi:hypothetical protein
MMMMLVVFLLMIISYATGRSDGYNNGVKVARKQSRRKKKK